MLGTYDADKAIRFGLGGVAGAEPVVVCESVKVTWYSKVAVPHSQGR